MYSVSKLCVYIVQNCGLIGMKRKIALTRTGISLVFRVEKNGVGKKTFYQEA